MGTIGQSMSATVENTPSSCCTMGSTAAKDKLISAAPFGLGTGHFHFGLGKGDSGSVNTVVSNAGTANSGVCSSPSASGDGDGGGGGGGRGRGESHRMPSSSPIATRSISGSSPSPLRRNVASHNLNDIETNGYNQDRSCNIMYAGIGGVITGERSRQTPPKPPPKPAGLVRLASLRSRSCKSPLSSSSSSSSANYSEMWKDVRFLRRFFQYFEMTERRLLAQVCSSWRNVLYQAHFWRGVLPVVHFRQLRANDGDPLATAQLRLRFYSSLQQRGFDSVCLCGANDDDVRDFVINCPSATKHIHHVILRCASITDKGFEMLLDVMQSVYQLELVSCNEITEAGLWSSLNPRIVSLTINDCINVADESLGAVSQLLPSLYEFNLQAYHVTDSALTYFSPKQSASLSILRLQSCWEISNQGVGNLVHALPNLTILSMAGCSKITDAGIEIIAENLRKLKCLDLSWCPRITDASLEYIACDLTQLEELTLDRCVHVTDTGIGYISTMLSLNTLFLRWCSQIRDFGLQHLCSMRNLQVLSVAGCPLLSSGGLSALIQLRHLRELELTNCPGMSQELSDYLHQHLSNCLIIE